MLQEVIEGLDLVPGDLSIGLCDLGGQGGEGDREDRLGIAQGARAVAAARRKWPAVPLARSIAVERRALDREIAQGDVPQPLHPLAAAGHESEGVHDLKRDRFKGGGTRSAESCETT